MKTFLNIKRYLKGNKIKSLVQLRDLGDLFILNKEIQIIVKGKNKVSFC